MRPSALPLAVLSFALVAGCTCGGSCGKKSTKPAPDYSALLKDLPKAQVSRAEAILPQTPVTVVTSDAKGTWDALMASELGKALVKGGAIEDINLSSQLEDLLSMAHEAAAASAHPLGADALATALVGRAGVGIVPSIKADGLVEAFVFVKEIDPSQETVVRLAVMLASIHGVRSTDHNGQRIEQIGHRGGGLYFSAFQNVVIASDSEVLASEAVDLALGKPGKPAALVAEIKEEASTLSGPQALVHVELEPEGPTAMITGLSRVLARLELGGPAVVKVRGALASEAAAVAAHRAQKFVPNDAALYLSLGASHPEAILNRLAKAGKVSADQVDESFAVSPELRAALGDEAFWALLAVQGESFEHLIGLSLKDAAKAKSAIPAFLKKWGHGETSDLSLGPEATGWCVQGKQLCAAVVKDFLLAATSESQLERAVRTARGESPALSDLKGLTAAIKPGEQHLLTAFVGTPHAADAALQFWGAAAARNSQGFDPGDVRVTMEPLCKALRELPPFGGAVDAKGVSLSGELRVIQ